MAYVPQSGSVVAFQSNPSVLQALVTVQGLQGHSISGTVVANPVGSVITVAQSSVAVAIVSGSIAASFTPPANQSVSGTVTANQGTNPWIITGSVQTSGGTTGNSSVQLLAGSAVIGSVMVLQGTNPFIITGSVQGSFSPSGNQSVSGTVMAQGQAAPGASVVGNPVYVGGVDLNGSVAGAKVVTVGSIAGGAAMLIFGSVQTVGGNSSVQVLNTVNVSGSVVSFQGTNPWVITGSVQTLTQPGSIVYGQTSTVSTAATQVIAAAGSGLRTYVTNFNMSNTGSVTTLVTFTDGDASVIGRTIAPGGGGSNAFLATPMVTSANQPFNMTAATATSTLYGAFYGYKAP